MPCGSTTTCWRLTPTARGFPWPFEEAQKTQRPVCVLVGDEYHGFNR